MSKTYLNGTPILSLGPGKDADGNPNDISGATDSKIYYKKPNGTEGEWAASVVDNRVEYQTVSGDLDQAGVYKLQSWVEIGAFQDRGDTVEFQVYDFFE